MSKSRIPQSGIYSIKHLSSGRIYIGSSVHIPQRWGQHRRQLRDGRHHSRFLQRAWDKYGHDSFEWQIIETTTNVESLVLLEQKWIDFYDASNQDKGFNVGPVVGSPNIGRTHTTQTRSKISAKTRGLKNPHANKLSFEDIPVVFQRLADGESAHTLASEFKVRRQSICEIARRRAYAWIPVSCELEEAAKMALIAQSRPRTLPQEMRDAIAENYCNGFSSVAIARDFGISSRSVFTILREKGIPSRPLKRT